MGGTFGIGGGTSLSFTVRNHQYGRLIDGSPTMDDFSILLEGWGKLAKERGQRASLHPGIARAEHAQFAVAFDQKTWLQDIDKRLESITDPELRWFVGPYTGISSLTIFGALADEKHAAKAREEVGEGDLPKDGDDWGRCYRCIVDCEFEGLLDDLEEKDRRWVPLVAAWPSLSLVTGAYYAFPGDPHEDASKMALAKLVDHMFGDVMEGKTPPEPDELRGHLEGLGVTLP